MMLNRYLLAPLAALLLLAAAPRFAHAQTTGGVGIGTTAPDASAALDIVSSSKGALLPRLTAAQRTAIAAPAPGLLVFQTDGTPGFYYNAGTAAVPSWQQLATADGAAITAANGLTKTGASIGLGGTLSGATTLAQAGFHFSLTGGNVGIGTTTPGAGLHVRTDEKPAVSTATGVYLSGGATGNPNIELRGNGGVTYIDFVNDLTTDYAARVLTGAGGLGVYMNGSATPQLRVSPTGTVNIATLGGSGNRALLTDNSGNLFTSPLPTPQLLSISGSDLSLSGGGGTVTLPTASGDNLGNHTATQNLGLGNFWLSYATGTSSGLRIGSTGRVGVGTASPVAALDVSGGGLLVRDSELIRNQGAHLQWNRSGNQGETWLINQQGGGPGGIVFGSSDAVSTGSNTVTEWGRFDSGGTLRLGSDDTNGASTGPALEWTGPGLNTDPVGLYRVNTALDQSELRVVVGDAPDASDKFVVGHTSVSGAGQIPGGTFTPKFSISSSGLVNAASLAGTGTRVVVAAADGTLSTSTAAGAGDNLGNHTATQNLNLGANKLVGNGGTSGLAIGSTGNVGIGVSSGSPTQKLDVRGNLRLGDDGGNVAGTGQTVEFVGPGVNTDPVGFYRVNTAVDQSQLRVVVGDAPDAGDKFVIGRSSASNEGGIPAGTFTPNFAVGSDGNVNVANLAGTGTRVVVAAADGTLSTSTNTGDNLGNHTATTNIGLNGNWLSNAPGNANGIRIDNTGKVGIGVAAPSRQLDVAGDAAITGAVRVGTPGDANSAGSVDITGSTVPPGLTLDQQQLTGGYGGGGRDQWQSFTAGISGNLTQLDLCISSPTGGNGAVGTLTVYDGEGVAGTLLTSQAIVMNQVINTFQQYPLNTPVPVLAGRRYTYRLSTPIAPIGFIDSGNNPYPGGINANGNGDGNFNVYGGDFLFKTYVNVLASTALKVTGNTRLVDLSSAGTRMVTASGDGTLGAAALPTDAQTLSVGSGNLSISGGNSVTLASLGDNLGNHTATTNLNLGTNALVGNGGSTGLAIGSTGNVGIGTSSAASQKLEVAGSVQISGTGNGLKFPDGSTQTTAATPANLTGDVTSVGAATTYTNVVPATKGGAGTVSGLLKANGSGVVSAATAGTDYLTPTGSAAGLTGFPTFNQNTTGNASTVTTNANLTGAVTSVGNATSYNQTVPATKGGAGTLTGILRANGSGTVTAAVAADFPTLNQSTTGNAATVTTNANLTGDITSTGNATTYTNVVPATKGGAGAVSGILKANGSGTVSQATAGTDYLTPAGASTGFVQNQTATTQTGGLNLSGNGYLGGNVGVGTTGPVTQLANTAGNVIATDGSGVSSQALNWVSTTTGYAGAFANTNTAANGHGLAVKVNSTSAAALDISQGSALATAGTSLLRVRGDGKVGIGVTTAQPATQKLDVRGNLRLGDDGNSATGLGQTVEFVGPGFNTDPVGLYRTNPASDASELRVVVGDASDANDKFSVGRSSATAEGGLATATFTPVFTVQSDGSVGIGTSSPARGLHVDAPESGTGAALGVLLGGGTSGNPSIELRGSGRTPYIDFVENLNEDFTTRLSSSGGTLNLGYGGAATKPTNIFAVDGGIRATAFNVSSDQRFKTNVRPIGRALSSVLALRGVRYDWNALGVRHGGTAGAPQVGLLAQEVEKIYPELVSTDKDGYKAVNYAQLTPVLIEALKEQQQQIEVLKQEAATAKAEATSAKAQATQATATLETFEARLRRLEAAGGQAQR